MVIRASHFDAAFEAPNGVEKLREFILTLAMQGKLVSQDPNDQPGSELFAEIEANKSRLQAEGQIKVPKPLRPVTTEEKPYALPQGWIWVRLGSICSYIQRGKSPSYVEISPNKVISQKCVRWNGLDIEPARYIDPSSLENYESIRFLRRGDLLWNSTGTGTIGRACLVPDSFDGAKLVADTHVTVVRSLLIDKSFLWRWIQSPMVQSKIESFASGTTNQIELNTSTVLSHLIPLPPLAEQHRIVTKLDELMARCDTLEKLRAERKKKRITINAAAIKQLLTSSAAHDQLRAQDFIGRHFSELYTVTQNVTELRKAIIQLAVLGKLVPSIQNASPSNFLIQKIHSEKNLLLKEGKIKAPKPQRPLTSENMSYPLPDGWQWVHLQDLIIFGPSNGFSPKAVEYETKVRSLTLSATTSGKFKEEFYKYLDIDVPEDSKLWLQDGDILVQRGNSMEYVGVSAVYRGESKKYIYPDLMMKIRLTKEVDTDYVYYVMSSEQSRDYFRSNASGTSGTMPKINQQALVSLPIPLPPFETQKKIVDSVERLMKLCDALEHQIQASTTKQAELLKSVLAQA
ncbi:restriction endonuclease subunit S [Pseudomonas sp. FP1742]|uniref:restriction endonuclease subunit S n=1 Tax=Pseudomonas sp. FP1742 TaxID=2954079 RepID=UPI002733A973|nr:restriction endonuclease subunit S [Pseudomonas sp. FP1742]WLG51224.1 restriction endonuclease subunit S [Pseudomonas sp. FP1742]